MRSHGLINAFAFAIVTLIASALIGCEPASPPASPDNIAPSAPAAPTSPAAIGAAAPNFSAVDFAGNTVTLSSYRGRVVVVLFWASWCKPCRDSFPHESALCARHVSDPFTFVGINMDVVHASGKLAARQHAHPWPNIHSYPSNQIGTDYAVTALPTTFVIDKTGVVRAKFVGMQPNDIEAAVAAELKK